MGDVKLAFVMGLFLGRDVGVADLRRARGRHRSSARAIMAPKGVKEGRKTAAALRPVPRLRRLVGLLAGEPIVDWYLATFA